MATKVDPAEAILKALARVAKTGDRVVVKHRGKAAAALISLDDLELLQNLEDQADIRAAREAKKEKGTIPLELVLKRLGIS